MVLGVIYVWASLECKRGDPYSTRSVYWLITTVEGDTCWTAFPGNRVQTTQTRKLPTSRPDSLLIGVRGKQSPKHRLRACPQSSVGCSCYCFSGCVSGLPNGLSSPFLMMFSRGNLDAVPEERKANKRHRHAPKARAASIQPGRRSTIRDFSPCHQEVSSSTGR